MFGVGQGQLATEGYFREIGKGLKQAVCLEYMLIFHSVAGEV